MSDSPSHAERSTSIVPVEPSAGSGHDTAEPSPFTCPDQNRAKQSKALLGLGAMLAISLSLYAYHHLDGFIARAAVGHHAHYAPAEDSSLHEAR